MEYCRSLSFDAQPYYERCRRLFESFFTPVDSFDWVIEEEPVPAPLLRAETGGTKHTGKSKSVPARPIENEDEATHLRHSSRKYKAAKPLDLPAESPKVREGPQAKVDLGRESHLRAEEHRRSRRARRSVPRVASRSSCGGLV